MDGRDHERQQGGEPSPTGSATEDNLLNRVFPEADAPLEESSDELQASRPLPGEQPEEGEADEERPTPRIYVASLHDYNMGRLHGVWIDTDRPVDDIHAEIQAMLRASPEAWWAEEWAIHDYEGFGSLELSEHESLSFVSDVAVGIAQHGEAFAAFAEIAERDQDRMWLFEEMYRGRWESLEAYAEHLLDELGVAEQLQQLPEWVQPYVSVDVQALVNELETGGSVMTVAASEGGVYVFDFE